MIGGNRYNNLFQYCSNTPIKRIDCGGFEESDIDDSFLYEDDLFVINIIMGIDPNHLAPNTTYHYRDTKGFDRYLWTDKNGRAIHSRHYTDHGKKYHEIPHDHDWFDKGDGTGNHEQDHSPLKPNGKYTEDDAIEYYYLQRPDYAYSPEPATDLEVLLFVVVEIALCLLGVPAPMPV